MLGAQFAWNGHRSWPAAQATVVRHCRRPHPGRDRLVFRAVAPKMQPAGSTVTAVTRPANMAGWRDLEQGAPEIARLGMARLAAVPVAMLGTVRPDGSPADQPGRALPGGRAAIDRRHGLVQKSRRPA